LAPGQRSKQRMSRTRAVTRACPDSLEQLQQRPALLFKRCRIARFQFGRRWGALREGNYIENEVLERKHLERALALGHHREFSDGHERRQTKMLQHTRYVHAPPSPRG